MMIKHMLDVNDHVTQFSVISDVTFRSEKKLIVKLVDLIY